MCRILHICRKIFIYHTLHTFPLFATVRNSCNGNCQLCCWMFSTVQLFFFCHSTSLATVDWDFIWIEWHWMWRAIWYSYRPRTCTLLRLLKNSIIEWSHLIELLHKFITWNCATAFCEYRRKKLFLFLSISRKDWFVIVFLLKQKSSLLIASFVWNRGLYSSILHSIEILIGLES